MSWRKLSLSYLIAALANSNQQLRHIPNTSLATITDRRYDMQRMRFVSQGTQRPTTGQSQESAEPSVDELEPSGTVHVLQSPKHAAVRFG